jgi:protein-S-isoprenylcysteine O-methyltransferase Ste14
MDCQRTLHNLHSGDMSLWFGKLAVIVALLGYCVIRGPHGHRSRTVCVSDDRKSVLEIVLLGGAFLGTTIMPIIWAVTGFPVMADFPLHPVPYAFGILAMVAGFWLFHRSHADLGTNWSITLQTRESHRLVTEGIYRRIRHPMYASMFLLSIAHMLFVPNWVVAPAYLVSFWVLYVFRVPYEERMMLDHFGAEYEAYMLRSGRLFPKARR